MPLIPTTQSSPKGSLPTFPASTWRHSAVDAQVDRETLTEACVCKILMEDLNIKLLSPGLW